MMDLDSTQVIGAIIIILVLASAVFYALAVSAPYDTEIWDGGEPTPGPGEETSRLNR